MFRGQVQLQAQGEVQDGVSRSDLQPRLASPGRTEGRGQVRRGDQQLALLASLPGPLCRVLQDQIQVRYRSEEYQEIIMIFP